MDDEDLVLWLTATDMRNWERELAEADDADIPSAHRWHGAVETRRARIDKKYARLAQERRAAGGRKGKTSPLPPPRSKRAAPKKRGIVGRLLGFLGGG